MNDYAIKADNLSKTYKLYDRPIDRLKESMHPLRHKYHRDFYALKDIKFEIKKGETVGIIGRNGSGKSTLLKIITGVLTPSIGSVKIKGKVSALLELGAGFNSELTGLENVYLSGTIMGYPKEAMDEKLEYILSFADIGDFVNQPVKSYSSGMFARLAFAVAINIDPEILIVDEALSVGDAAFQRKCFARMESFKNDGNTVLFVSHSEGAILNLCERAILLDGGEKISDGEPKTVIGNYLRLLSLSNNDFLQYRADLKSGLSGACAGISSQRADEENINRYEYNEEYISSLLSISTTEYESKGVKLKNPIITTLDGKKVNILIHGRKYIYSYEAYFTEHCFNVNFGMLIKTLEGSAIGGGEYPSYAAPIRYIPQGISVIMKWEFECLLEEGIYFTNCGVMSTREGARDYAHRILDAYMFKVVSLPGRISTGYIDFKLKVNIASFPEQI